MDGRRLVLPAPLRLSLAGGVVVAVLGLAEGTYAVVRALTVHDTTPGWTSSIAITCLIGGAVLVSIGILGEYVGRIFEESKGRPLYLVSTTANLSEANSPDSEAGARDSEAGSPGGEANLLGGEAVSAGRGAALPRSGVVDERVLQQPRRRTCSGGWGRSGVR